MPRRLSVGATLLALGSFAGAAGAQTAYSLLDIGLPPGQSNITAMRLSPDGAALVYCAPGGGGTRSYLWASGVFLDLGKFDATLARNEAYDINSAGAVAGSSWGSGFPAHAWRWTDGSYAQVPTLGGLYANAYSISDNGFITGWAQAPEPANFFAYLFDGTSTVNLGELPGAVHSTGYAVNSDGTVACESSALFHRSWSCAAVAGLREGMHEIGTLGGGRSFVHDINEHGHVAGYSDIACNAAPDHTKNPSHAFLWREGVMTDLGRLPGTAVSVAHALNDSDVVVGASRASTDFNAAEKACRWIDGQIADLNTLVPAPGGYTLARAVSINNSGQILAKVFLGAQARVVILTPVP